MTPLHAKARREGGFALIEVLVSFVILVFGLLGLAGIGSRANLAEMESYQRSQALAILQDMAERLNANRKVPSCYSNGVTGQEAGNGVDPATLPACLVGTAQERAQANADLRAWDALLRGQAESAAGANLGAMIGAVGCITLDDAPTNTYMIAVSWQGLVQTAAPLIDGGTAFPCGNGAYGNEKLHRVVTTKVRIGALS